MTDIDARLAQIRSRFRQRCREDLAAIEAGDMPAAELQRVAHRMAGMAGTLGMNALGEAARALDAGIGAGEPSLERKRALIEALRVELAE
ncbi:MAG: Hpt domain-containing protein [Sphingobium sp.]|uniref:Hpt domain-containing protein n=1 Tax=Sphingobium sp. TaxID=1912891 RepID=UPI002E1BCE61